MEADLEDFHPSLQAALKKDPEYMATQSQRGKKAIAQRPASEDIPYRTAITVVRGKS